MIQTHRKTKAGARQPAYVRLGQQPSLEAAQMLELHAFMTPNSLKPVIALEEMQLEYTLSLIDLRKGQQRNGSFRLMNPNGKVPVLIDRDASSGTDVILAESAAILVYLSEKTGELAPHDPANRAKMFEQLFFHASGVSPAFLQAFLVGLQKDPPAEAKEKALKEVDRVLDVLDHRLEGSAFVAGQNYTIADVAHFGWIWRHSAIGADISPFEQVARWYAEVEQRPAVQSAIAKLAALVA